MNETVLSEGLNVSGFSLPFPKSHNPEIQPVKKGTVICIFYSNAQQSQ